MNFKSELESRIIYAESVIYKFIPKPGMFDSELTAAIEYSLKAPGKRIRPILIQAFYKLFGGSDDIYEPCMAAMEMLHTYSLVHDDMPAIDNDELRRGIPTTHNKFGEALALLAGDGLLHQAYETFIKIFDQEVSERTVNALRIFADKTGINGMLGGQTADVVNTGRVISDDLMYYIYENKTAALIEASMMIGASLAGCDKHEQCRIEKMGSLVGIAFQIRDDILDEYGDMALTGKPIHSDNRNNKKTYLSVNGLDKSIRDINAFSDEALQILNQTGVSAIERDFISGLFDYLINRNK